MRPAISGCRAMLSRAAAPMRPKPQPAPMIVRAAPRPAPTPRPDSVNELTVGCCWAIAGTASNNNAPTTIRNRFRTFMDKLTPVCQQRSQQSKTHRAAPSMLGVQRHPHEQRGQEDENIRLQEGDEQL